MQPGRQAPLPTTEAFRIQHPFCTILQVSAGLPGHFNSTSAVPAAQRSKASWNFWLAAQLPDLCPAVCTTLWHPGCHMLLLAVSCLHPAEVESECAHLLGMP